MVRDNQAVRYDPELPGDGSAQEQAPDAVGRLLAQARMDLGYELTGVAAELRIRLPYLQAIEDTRYQDLPGMPYAIGFVRSYAEFVGLDPEATVALFKTEVRDLGKSRQQLSFPAPKPEGRLPGGALVLLSLVVVAVAYGGWYLWNESGRPFVEMLPALESEQGVEMAEAPSEPAPEPQAAPEAAPEAASEAAGEAAEQTVEAPSGNDVAAAPVIEAPAPAEPPAADSEAESGQAESAAAGAVPAPPQPPAEAAEEPAAVEAPAEEATPEPAEEVAQDAAEEPAQAETETEAAAANAQTAAAPLATGSGQVYGDEGGGVRVVLIATADSWVQIRGGDDELLFTRVLRPGDSYRVPNQAGLTLLTGNAGGLDVVVDGQRLPTLGPQGAVRRDVPLDAEALRNQVN